MLVLADTARQSGNRNKPDVSDLVALPAPAHRFDVEIFIRSWLEVHFLPGCKNAIFHMERYVIAKKLSREKLMKTLLVLRVKISASWILQ